MILHDAVIPFHEKDISTIEKCCDSLRDVLDVKRIFLISKNDPNVPNTIFISEREFTNIVPLFHIQDIWNISRSKYAYRSGWIYQQLLKLGASELIPDLSDDYIISDTDIIFLSDPYEGVPSGMYPYDRAYKGEYHDPYRLNYARLMKEQTTAGFSFINHHMVKNKFRIAELKKFIEERNSVRWDHAIINALDLESFSDFASDDLYGNWMYKYHNEKTMKVDIRIHDITHIPGEGECEFFKNRGFHILSSQQWARA